MEVGRQDEGDPPQPVHHADGLGLPGLDDGDELVGEVAVQVVVVAVVASFVALNVACQERRRPSFTRLHSNSLRLKAKNEMKTCACRNMTSCCNLRMILPIEKNAHGITFKQTYTHIISTCLSE